MKPYLNKYNDGSKIIIYMNSRKNCQDMTDVIKNMGFKVECYHAGLSKGMRNKIQNQFSSGNINIIVSTVAFGMGIDQAQDVLILVPLHQRRLLPTNW